MINLGAYRYTRLELESSLEHIGVREKLEIPDTACNRAKDAVSIALVHNINYVT